MGYSLLQISEILLKADKTMYRLGTIAYENMFSEDSEDVDFERDIIYIYKKAVEYADDFYVGTTKLDQVVERLANKLTIYNYGSLNPIYSDVSILRPVLPTGYVLNDLADVTITNLQDNQILKYSAALGQWVNTGSNAAIRSTQAFTATLNQTVFVTTSQFTAPLLDVYLNGVRLNSASYSTFGNHTITLYDGCLADDIIDVTIYDPQTDILDMIGYMKTSVYDTDNDGIVDDAEKITIIARNSTGSTIHKGKIVYLQGSTGNRPNIVLAQANSEAASSKTFGVVVEDIADNADGQVAAIGTLHDLDTRSNAAHPFTTDTLLDGDKIWLSATNPGYVTKTPPTQPNHTVFIGFVARTTPSFGRIIYNIQNGFELNELHNVLIASEANKDILNYDSTTGLWKNSTKAAWLGGTASQFVKGDGSLDSTLMTNIYNSDGTLTGNRVVTMGGNTLSFDGGIYIKHDTQSALISTYHETGSEGLNIYIGGGGQLSQTGGGASFLGSRNTSVGRNNLLLNTTGRGNTSIGTYSMSSNTTGIANTSVGVNALRYNTTGNFNTAFGSGALGNNSTGSSNVAIGGGLGSNVSSSFNVSIGINNLALSTGGNNTSIGYQAGYGTGTNANTTGSNNIFIGYLSVGASSTESNRTWIGNSSTTSTWLGGNLLLGTTTDAGYKLDVNGATRVIGGITIDGDSSIIGAGSSRLFTISGYAANLRLVGSSSIGQFNISKGFGYAQISSINEEIRYDSPSHLFGGTTYVGSALVNIESTTKGFLPPRMTTTQRDAIASPATGLVIYNTTTLAPNVYNGTSWGAMGGDNIYTADGTLTGNRTVTYTGNSLTFFTVRPSVGNRYITFHNSGRVTFNGTTENTSFEVNVNGQLLAGAGSMIGGTSGVNFDTSSSRLIFQDWASVSFVRSGGVSVLYSDGTTASLGNGSARLNLTSGSFSTNGGGLGSGAAVYSIGPGTNNITTGAYTVSIGSENLYGVTTGSTNIAIGGRWSGSGVSRGNTGNHSSSIFLGVGTGATTNSTTLTNTTIIGHDITTDASNTVILGRSDQNVIVGGTVSAGYKLDVQGTTRVTGVARFENAVEFRSTNGNNKFTIASSSNWNTVINYGSWGSAAIKFIDNQSGGMMIGQNSDALDGNAMLDLRSNSLGLFLNRGTVSTMPNLSTWGGVSTSIIGGSGYTDGSYTAATATGNYSGSVVVNVTVSGGAVTSVSYYGGHVKTQLGETFTIPAASIGGTGSGMSFTITAVSNNSPAFTFYDTNQDALSYWNGRNYATPIVSKLDRVLIGGSGIANATSILELSSTTKGFLQPRMTTTQRDAISTPATGLSVYNTTTNTNDYYNGTAWVSNAAGNIYTADGALTADRVVSNGAYTLTIKNASNTSAPLILQNTQAYGAGGVYTQYTQQWLTSTGANAGYVLGDIGRLVMTSLVQAPMFYVGSITGMIDAGSGGIGVSGSPIDFSTAIYAQGGTNIGRWFATGNLLIQTGGTFTDSGYKLDVKGTARINAMLTLDSATGGTFRVKNNDTTDWDLGEDVGESTRNFNIYNYNTTSISLSINRATNAVSLFSLGTANGTITNLTTTSVSAFTAPNITLNRASGGYFIVANNGTNDWGVGEDSGDSSRNFNFYNYNTTSINLSLRRTTGNFVINSNSDTGEKLQVNGTAKVSGALYTGTTSNVGIWMLTETAIRGTATTGGNLYIDANSSLDGTGTIHLRGLVNSGQLSVGGNLTVTGAQIFVPFNGGLRVNQASNGNLFLDASLDFTGNVFARATSFVVELAGGVPTTYASAIVAFNSTTKGFLPPRMTSTQRTAISSPAVGLIVYQTDSTEGTYEYTSAGWRIINAAGGGSGTVTTVSVATANGFAGTVANATTTPAITISTTVTGLLKGNGTAISAATAGTDYLTPSDVAYSIASVTTTHTETATKGTKIIKADTTGGSFTINLPTAVGNTATIIIKKVAGSGALTIDGNSTETIDGGTTATINRVYESITLISDNTNWQIV